MGIQGNKATTHEHDFLSLYTAAAAKDSSLQLHDSEPPPPSQGFFLKTHDFLQPLEKPAPPSGADRQQHALPGGIGTFSISRVPGARPSAEAVVKAELPFAVWGQPAAAHHGAARGHQWTLPFAGVGQVATAPRQQPPQRKGRSRGGFMDSGSRSSGGAGFDDDDGLAARREVSSSLKEI